jgi:serine/threonine protein kinase
MAPEHFGVIGDLSKVDTFSLGVLLVTLLTGKTPFDSIKDESF